MLWNMVDAREKTDLYEKASRVMDGAGLSVLNTYIPDSKRFRKECAEVGNKAVFRSTILQKLIPTTHATKQGINGRTYTKGDSKERSQQAKRSYIFQGYFFSHG